MKFWQHTLYSELLCNLYLDSNDFIDWLAPVPANRHKAYCKFCRKLFRAHRTDLRTHARSKKHQQAGDVYYTDTMMVRMIFILK